MGRREHIDAELTKGERFQMCVQLNRSVSTQNVYVEAIIPNVMVLRAGAFEK